MKEQIDRFNALLAGCSNIREVLSIMDAALGDVMQADNSEEGSQTHLALTGLHLCFIELEARIK